MRLPRSCLVAMAAALALPAAAQTAPDPGAPTPAAPAAPNPTPPPTTGELLALPAPELAEDGSAQAFLQAARGAVAAGRMAEAQEALERAESRALVRDVRPSRAGQPSRQPVVEKIAQARAALAAGDRMATVELIEEALAADAAEPE